MKIVVVGGGPAGSTAARFLAPHFDVVLIQDKKWTKPCGGGTKTTLFDEFDIDKKLIKNKFSFFEIKFKKNSINLDIKDDNLSIVFRDEFDEYLRNKAKQNGAKIIYDKLIDIKNNTAILKKQSIKFDILIAADGVNSITRKLMNLPEVPKVLTHYALINKQIKKPIFYFDRIYGGNFYAWEFPHLNKTHIGSDASTFQNFINHLNIKTSNKGYFIPSWNKNIKIQQNNIYFVGDSAAQVMPLTFEGIHYAIESAKILANSIINNLNYQKEWNKKFLFHFKIMKLLENTMKQKILREIMLFSFKSKFIQNFSVKLWLKS